jgi:branched-chain amino acid aminotransferase
MEDLVCYFNGEFIKESEVKFSIYDGAFRDGMVYDMGRTYNQVPLFVEEHIDRVFRSCQAVRIHLNMTKREMIDITYDVVERNKSCLEPYDDFNIHYLISRGERSHFFDPPSKPTILIHVFSLIPTYANIARNYLEGVRLVVVNTRQIPPDCLDPKIKHINRLCNSMADHEAKMVDPKAWGLMLDIQGRVAEGPTFNCHMVKDGKIFTTRLNNALGGITRNKLITLASEQGIEVESTDLFVYDFYDADEIFATANSFTIMPVSMFNEKELPKPIPGSVTRKLFDAFSKLVGVDIFQRPINYIREKEKATG